MLACGCLGVVFSQALLHALFQVSKMQNCKIFCPRTSLLSKPTKCSRSQRTMWQPNTLENITRATCNNPHIHESKTTSFLSKARQGIPLVCAFIHRGRQTFLLHFLLVDRSRLATGESQFERKFLGLQKFPACFLAKSMWHERV